MSFHLLSLLAAVGLAAVHMFSQRLRVLDGVPRSRFLSIAGGVAVAFVLLRLLPTLSEGQQTLKQAAVGTVFGVLTRHVYVVVLVSVALFYGLERVAQKSRRRNRVSGQTDVTSRPVFWLHMATFAVMNALIGYLLLHNQERSADALLLFFFAMLLKFVVNDHALHAAHKAQYDNSGRWLLAGAVLIGWGTRALIQLPEAVPVILQAFLAGGVLLNVLKEELPEAQESRYWAFAVGAFAYTVILLAF